MYIRRDVARAFALMLVALVLWPDSPGGVFYRCHMDGQLRPTCCCPQESAAAAEQETIDQLATPGCCDVVVQAASKRDVVAVDPAPELPPRTDFVAVLAASPWATPTLTALLEPSRPPVRPPRIRTSLFLEVRSLLI